MRVTSIAAMLIFGLMGTAQAQTGSGSGKLQKLKGEFDREKESAKRDAAKAFDTMIERLKKSSGMSASARANLILQINDDKARFVNQGDWPDNGDMAGVAFAYARRINAKYVPVFRQYETEIDQALKANNLGLANTLTKEKETFENDVAGRGKMVQGAKWHGTRYGSGGGTSELHLNLTKSVGNVVEANVHFAPAVANHDLAAVRGTVDGIYVNLQIVRMVRGGQRNLTFEGFVIGNKMLVSIKGVGANKKPVNDWAWLGFR